MSEELPNEYYEFQNSNWKIWNPETEQLPENPLTFKKISVVTTCMGRCHDLKLTLPKNISDNMLYPNYEFVIVNYNSKDDLESWLFSDMKKYIDNGIINYVKTTTPTVYSMAHSRNIGFKHATGDIVNSVDADNYIHSGFFDYINKLSTVCPEKALFTKGMKLLRGRIGFYKKDFISLGGYDENLQGYGYDDRDLWLRAMCSEYKLMWYGGQYVDRIKTDRIEKVKNFENKNWKEQEKINKEISHRNIINKIYVANQGKKWGEI